MNGSQSFLSVARASRARATVRSNSSNSCWKSPQIEGQNLEAWVFIHNFASSKRGRNGAAATRLQRESPKNWKAGVQEWRVKDWEWSVKDWEWRIESEEWRIESEGLRVKSEEWRISYRGPKGIQKTELKHSAETELKQFDWRQERIFKAYV